MSICHAQIRDGNCESACQSHCSGMSPLSRGARERRGINQPGAIVVRELASLHTGKSPIWRERVLRSPWHPRSRVGGCEGGEGVGEVGKQCSKVPCDAVSRRSLHEARELDKGGDRCPLPALWPFAYNNDNNIPRPFSTQLL